MPTALVTGAAGFVGSNLVEALADRGYAVRGVDNFETGRRSNLEPLDSLPEFSFHEADIRDGDAMADLMDGVDYLFHQAAVASVPRSVEDPVTTTDANCTDDEEATTAASTSARRAASSTVAVPVQLASVVVTGSSTLRGTEATAAWWKR